MISGSTFDSIFQRVPVPIRWAGWESNTDKLQRHGWSVSAHQDMRSAGFALALQSGGDRQVRALTSMVDPRVFESMRSPSEFARFLAAAGFDVQAIRFGDRQIMIQNMPIAEWSAVDATPSFRDLRMEPAIALEDFVPFAKVAAEGAKEIIVDPERIDELMALMLEAQAPEQSEIRKRRRRREQAKSLELGAERVCAQIISLADVA